MNQKFFLLMVFILQFRLDFSRIQKQKWISYCQNDHQFFPMPKIPCDKIFRDYQFSEASFVNTFNSLFGDRDIEFVTKDRQKVVIKRLADADDIENMRKEVDFNDESMLKEYFLDDSRVGGSYICQPNVTIDKFYQILPKEFKNRKKFWILLNINAQPLILGTFRSLPIPQQLDLIGFTSVTEYKGESLVKFVSSDFGTRLQISKLLLEGVLKLTSDDLKGFRIYLTDLTLDNIVYDPVLNEISFVDLDNVILIDSQVFSGKSTKMTHVHEKFECNGCFAYSIEDVCSAPVSDINVFAVCQILLEDLYENRGKGFLHPSPEIKEKNPEIWLELEKCVYCKQPNCDRFKSASKLLEIFDKILKIY